MTTTLFTPTEDAYVESADPDKNNGGNSEWVIGLDEGPKTPLQFRQFVRRTITGMTSSQVTAASINAYAWQVLDPGNWTIIWGRVAQPWDEATVTWNNQPTAATMPSSDSHEPVLAWNSWNALDLVKDALDNRSGILDIRGSVLTYPAGSKCEMRVFSKEHVVPEYWPYISVTYTAAGGGTKQVITIF